MAQKTEVEIGVRDKATTELKGIAGAFEKMRVSVETNNKGINKLDGAFRGLGAQAASLPGPLGRVADALADFAPGGLAGGAALAGLALIAMAFKHQKEKQEELLKATDNAKKVNEDLRLSYIRLSGGVEEYNKAVLESTIITSRDALNKAVAELTNYFNEVDAKARARAARMPTGAGFAGEEGAAATRGTQQLTLEERIAAQRQSILGRSAARRIELEGKVVEAQAALNNALADKQEDTAKRTEDAAADRAKAILDAENARKKALQESLMEYQRLYDLNQSGLPLTTQQQELLNQKTEQYKLIAFDTNASLEERIAALNILKQIEADRQKILDEQKRKEKELEDERKKAEKERADREKKALEERIERQVREREELLSNLQIGLDIMTTALVQGDNAFKALGKGARESIAGILRSLSTKLKVQGLEAFAQGVKALTNPLEAPRAPGLFKSAALFFAGAAAAGMGSAGVAAGGGGGTGGFGGGFSNSQLGRNNFTTQQPLTIVIQGGLLDMSNPDTQRSFVGALETVSSRRITINRVGA